jgi:adenine/guanine phosphoribosyltransferase-like PRPP-binding protein
LERKHGLAAIAVNDKPGRERRKMDQRMPSKITRTISGNWDDGVAVEYHSDVGLGGARILGRLADLSNQARSDQSAFAAVADAVCEHAVFSNLRPDMNYDCIIPVPPSMTIGPAAKGDFVYDIAAEISARSGIPIFHGLVTTRRASSLNGTKGSFDRSRLRDGLYCLLQGDVLNGRRVLVFDDVVNTGATLNEVVKTIRSASCPRQVDVLAITAAGRLGNDPTQPNLGASEMAETFKEFQAHEYDDVAYLSDGVWVSKTGKLFIK